MEFDNIDEEATTSLSHFCAGALAGTMEHTGMYPIDTVKTLAQLKNNNLPITQVARNLYQSQGPKAFFRGITAVIVGAAPSHAVYFTTYEFMKQNGSKISSNQSVTFGLAGAVATILSDAILTPMDTVKQRRQLAYKLYPSNMACIRQMIKNEGIRALYAGYSTTLLMNVPFHAIYVNIYEFVKAQLILHSRSKDYDVKNHIISGGIAGLTAAAMTNPLDVVKTRLQTQGDTGLYYTGMVNAFTDIWKTEGMKGMMKGIQARMLFHSLSAGILWTTYEYFKYIFGAKEIPIENKE